ncbi:MAG: type II secretion system protein J [Planctomycetota bacterium]
MRLGAARWPGRRNARDDCAGATEAVSSAGCATTHAHGVVLAEVLVSASLGALIIACALTVLSSAATRLRRSQAHDLALRQLDDAVRQLRADLARSAAVDGVDLPPGLVFVDGQVESSEFRSTSTSVRLGPYAEASSDASPGATCFHVWSRVGARWRWVRETHTAGAAPRSTRLLDEVDLEWAESEAVESTPWRAYARLEAEAFEFRVAGDLSIPLPAGIDSTSVAAITWITTSASALSIRENPIVARIPGAILTPSPGAPFAEASRFARLNREIQLRLSVGALTRIVKLR